MSTDAANLNESLKMFLRSSCSCNTNIKQNVFKNINLVCENKIVLISNLNLGAKIFRGKNMKNDAA